ncbi:lactate dehydrogenase [Pseudomonas gingeri]|uniref:lactate dehydrogenase n=1 Tax=Pseudomonas gingeri TaxID=117681 RepID=UPI0015A23099|nr:lactate dehydrogenase [Pseudomonas gingeri]NWD71102.1 lactate dehydrogenase [Pseudomonas gingeri]
MTGISSITAVTLTPSQLVANLPAGQQTANTTAAVSSPASSVILGQNNVVGISTYNARGALPNAALQPAWEGSPLDRVSFTMGGNLASKSNSARFAGLGAALLTQLAEGRKNISQSVVQQSGSKPLNAAELSAAQAKLHSDNVDSAITLTLKTASGKTVTLSLSNQDTGMAVQAQVEGGDLTDQESAALAKMAKGFQSAIDGLTAEPPQLKLDALTQFDSKVFSSVDLNTKLKIDDNNTPTLVFHADSQQRSVKMSGPSGDLQLSVDLKNQAILGNASQQAKALQSYLKQIDAAAARGHADRDMMSMFKDAFSSLNSNYPATRATSTPATVNPLAPTNLDRNLLTGLADFSASMTQKSEASNPMRPLERDTFAYNVSQTTQLKGSDPQNRSIEQHQQSSLNASFHQSLSGQKLRLTTNADSQNYLFYQIADTADSQTSIGYKDGELTNASVTQSASQSTHIAKYVMGRLVDQTSTPVNTSKTQSFLDVLERSLHPDQDDKTSTGAARLKELLAGLQDKVLLDSYPKKLNS